MGQLISEPDPDLNRTVSPQRPARRKSVVFRLEKLECADLGKLLVELGPFGKQLTTEVALSHFGLNTSAVMVGVDWDLVAARFQAHSTEFVFYVDNKRFCK